MALVRKRCVEGLHARWETLPLVVVEVTQIDLLAVFRRIDLRKVKLNRVVVAEVDEQLRETNVRQDG